MDKEENNLERISQIGRLDSSAGGHRMDQDNWHMRISTSYGVCTHPIDNAWNRCTSLSDLLWYVYSFSVL